MRGSEATGKSIAGPSPNAMTNLILADIVLRGGSQLLRRAAERTLVNEKHAPGKARDIVAGRTFGQFLVGAVLSRVATASVPGAVVVGGGMLVKTLYDRTRSRRASREDGEQDLQEQADKA